MADTPRSKLFHRLWRLADPRDLWSSLRTLLGTPRRLLLLLLIVSLCYDFVVFLDINYFSPGVVYVSPIKIPKTLARSRRRF